MPAPATNVASSSPSESVSPSSRAVIAGRSSPIPPSPASSRSDDDPGTRAADHRPMPEGDAGPDPRALLRSSAYVKLLVIAAVIGVPVSAAAYGFLALVDWLQSALFDDLPSTLGFAHPPVWWPAPLLVIGGLAAGAAIRFLPGTGGHSPADGLKT